ncbi:MAG TPA: hypothetical protein VFB29_00265 [Pseudolabrys sp.]|nr:hypothetical protein [Pseudolabrys sp.]
MTEITRQTEYSYYFAALAGKAPPCSGDSERHSGRYRMRIKNKQTGEVSFRPVAFWRDWSTTPPRVLCKVGDKIIDDELRACEIWTHCAANPITSEVYKTAVATGEWPDVHPAAQSDREAHADMKNSPNAPDPDSLEAVRDSVENLAREAELLVEKGAATSQDASDRAADLADRLRKLEVKADERRKKLHEPHKAEIKKLDGLWNPVRDLAASAKERLKLYVVTPFLRAKDAEAAKLREQAAKVGDNTPQTAAAIDKASRTVAGTNGKAALREFKSAKIADYQKTLAYFAENSKVRDLIQQLADAAVRTGTVPDGCEIHVEKRAA